MINYTKKWWLLRCFRKAERIHSTIDSADGNRVLLSQRFFIQGNQQNWTGLANKYNRYVIFRLSWLVWWKKEYNRKKLKEKINDYNDIYESCIDSGHIGKDKATDWPTVSTEKAYRIRSFPFGYFQGFLEEYDRVWVVIGGLILALVGLIGSFFAGVFVGGS